MKNSYFNPKHIFSVFNLKSFTNRSFAHLYLTVQKVPEEAHGKYCLRWSAPSCTLTECECCDALNKMFLRVCLHHRGTCACTTFIVDLKVTDCVEHETLTSTASSVTSRSAACTLIPSPRLLLFNNRSVFCFVSLQRATSSTSTRWTWSPSRGLRPSPRPSVRRWPPTPSLTPPPSTSKCRRRASRSPTARGSESERGTKLLSLSYLSHLSPVFYIQRLKQAASNKTNNVWTQWSVELSKMHEYKSNKWIKWHLQNLRSCL